MKWISGRWMNINNGVKRWEVTAFVRRHTEQKQKLWRDQINEAISKFYARFTPKNTSYVLRSFKKHDSSIQLRVCGVDVRFKIFPPVSDCFSNWNYSFCVSFPEVFSFEEIGDGLVSFINYRIERGEFADGWGNVGVDGFDWRWIRLACKIRVNLVWKICSRCKLSECKNVFRMFFRKIVILSHIVRGMSLPLNAAFKIREFFMQNKENG